MTSATLLHSCMDIELANQHPIIGGIGHQLTGFQKDDEDFDAIIGQLSFSSSSLYIKFLIKPTVPTFNRGTGLTKAPCLNSIHRRCSFLIVVTRVLSYLVCLSRHTLRCDNSHVSIECRF
jgi:hypothetical protein